MVQLRPDPSRGMLQLSGSTLQTACARDLALRRSSWTRPTKYNLAEVTCQMCARDQTAVDGNSRRAMLLTGAAVLNLVHASKTEAALVRFPAIELNNTYVLVWRPPLHTERLIWEECQHGSVHMHDCVDCHHEH